MREISSMAGFRALTDACSNFEEELRKISAGLNAAKVEETLEDAISKKLCDLSLFTSKLRLLRANSSCLAVSGTDKERPTVLSEYADTATWAVIERQTVKSVSQFHAVNELLSTRDDELSPALVERKRQIIQHLKEYSLEESMLQQLDTMLSEREKSLRAYREQWDVLLGELRDLRNTAEGGEVEASGQLYPKLKLLVDKLEAMRWLISRLAAPRSRGYDWLADPHGRWNAIKLARHAYTVSLFVHGSHQ